jgi:hypothetical protein
MDSDTDYDQVLSKWFSQAPAAADAEAEDLGPLGGSPKSPQHVQALERVREWVRDRFKLSPEAAILVAEVACNLPGCPPLETAVAFWENEQRHHFKLFKPVEEVMMDNLPFAWMKESLVVPEGFGCECC